MIEIVEKSPAFKRDKRRATGIRRDITELAEAAKAASQKEQKRPGNQIFFSTDDK